jgi:hypothetical protein
MQDQHESKRLRSVERVAARVTVKILQIMPADGWRALYAERLETGHVELWTAPLMGWALVEQTVPTKDGYRTKDVIRHVDGLVCVSMDGPVLAQETANFLLTYVPPQEDLEPYRSDAESFIAGGELYALYEKEHLTKTNGGDEPQP